MRSGRLEHEQMLRMLARHGSPEEAAQVLGIDPATLWRKRKRWEGDWRGLRFPLGPADARSVARGNAA